MESALAGILELSNDELETLLERLETEERDVSRRRRALHTRIEFISGGGGATVEVAADQLAALHESEREISDRRRSLHVQIDTLRTEASRRLT